MFKKLLIIIMVFLGFTACGLKIKRPYKSEVNNIEGYSVGNTIRPARALNSEELVAATSICRDLRAKRNRWEVSRDGLSFNFDVKSRATCSGSPVSYQLNASVEVAGGNLILDTPSRSKFIKDVMTDLHPAIANICDDVLAGTNDIINTVELSGTLYQTTFYQKNGNFYSLISRFAKDSNGVWRAIIVDESLTAVKQRTSNALLVGIVSKRVQQTNCNTGGSTYIEQTIR